MEKKKEKITNFIKNNGAFFIYFIVILILHLTTNKIGDDLEFAKYLNDKSLPEFLKFRYNTWTSRLIIEAILSVLAGKVPFIVWKIADSFVFLSMSVLISKLINKENNGLYNVIICSLVSLLSYTIYSEAGYMATTINYIFPFTCLLYSLYVVDKIVNNKKVRVGYVLSIITTIIACNAEQACLIFFGFAVLIIGYLIINKKFKAKHLFIVFLILICLAELIFIATCPGNDQRNIYETEHRYQEFANFGIVEKCYLGIASAGKYIVEQRLIFTIFSFLLMIVTFMKSKNQIYRFMSVLDFGFFVTISTFKEITLNIFPKLTKFYDIFGAEQIYGGSIGLSNIACLLVFLYLSLSMLFLLFKLYKDKPLYSVIFLAGLLSRFIMGFSPTVFASGSRPTIYLFYGVSMLSTILYIDIDKNKINSKSIEKADNGTLVVSNKFVTILSYSIILLALLQSACI